MKKRKHLKTKKQIAEEQSNKYRLEHILYGKTLNKNERVEESRKQQELIDGILDVVKENDAELYAKVKADKNHFFWVALIGYVLSYKNPKNAIEDFEMHFKAKGIKMFFQGVCEDEKETN